MEKLIKLVLTKGQIEIPFDEKYEYPITKSKIIDIRSIASKREIDKQLEIDADIHSIRIPNGANSYLASKNYVFNEEKDEMLYAVVFYHVDFTKTPRQLGEKES